MLSRQFAPSDVPSSGDPKIRLKLPEMNAGNFKDLLRKSLDAA